MIAFGILFLISIVLYLVGTIMSLVGFIKSIIDAFRTSILWGMAYFFVPFASLLFWILHWAETRESVILYFKEIGITLVACLGFYFAYCMAPQNIQDQFLAGYQRGNNTTSGHEGSLPKTNPVTIAQEDVNHAKDQMAVIQTKVNQTYVQLTEKRKTLDPKNAAAVHAFNLEAAEYAKAKTELAAQTKELARLNQQLELLQVQTMAAQSKKQTGVVIYSTSWCPTCKVAKRYFADKKIPYTDIDVEQSRDGAAEFKRLGGGGVPLLVINGNQMTGFNSDWVDKNLKK